MNRRPRGIAATIDRLVARAGGPEPLIPGSERLRRYRIAVGTTGLVGAILLVAAIGQLIAQHYTHGAILMGVLLGGVGMAYWLNRYEWTGGVGHAVAAIIYCECVTAMGPAPGLHEPATLGLVGLAALVTLLSGGYGAWGWCGLSVATFIGVGLVIPPYAQATPAWVTGLGALTIGLTAIAQRLEHQRARAYRELTCARDDAQIAVETKSRFLANMSHEIRTPMNGVLGMLGILLDTKLDEQQRSYAKIAHRSGEALLKLLNDVLDFSKIDAGQMLLELSAFDLEASIEDVLDQAAIAASKKKLDLIMQYRADTPARIIGDHGRIRQILLNLVGNAIKFTEQGHILVVVERSPQDTGDVVSRIRCSVMDTGIGIADEEHDRVFDIFQQVDSSTVRTQSGTGLGLTIVRELVALMDGTMGLSSTPGRGSTFWFDLPLPAVAPFVSTSTDSLDFDEIRVLLADGHDIRRQVLREQLERRGIRVDACGEGRLALEHLRRAAQANTLYSVAVLDDDLRGIGGMELSRMIKNDAAIENLPLVRLGLMTRRPSTEELLAAGFAEFVGKPIHRSEFIRAIVRAGAPAETPRSFARRISSLTPIGTPGLGMRVLVAEDNAVNQHVARHMLSDLGCQVDVASNGHDAVRLIAQTAYDVVFMDVQMPHLGGLEATAEIRRRETNAERPLPIVAMTAHAMSTDRDRCLAAGMNGYVSKPVSRRDLLREILEYRSSGMKSPLVLRPAAVSTEEERPAL